MRSRARWAFLGLFAALGGHQHDGLRALTLTLEDRVAARTRELQSLTERMALVLSSTSDALITIGLDGTLDGPPQAQSKAWFGDDWERKSLCQYVAADNNRFRLDLMLGLEQIRDDILPIELTLNQLPSFLETEDGRSLALEYVPLDLASNSEQHLLVVLSDVTSEVKAEQLHAEQVEQQTLVAQLLQDPSGFRLFRSELEALLEQVRSTKDPSVRCRLVHTIKGNSAVYGLARLALACQSIEDDWAQSGQVDFDEERYRGLRKLVDAAMAQVAPFLAQDDSSSVRIARQDIVSLLDDVRKDMPQEAVVRTLRDWSMEPVRPVLERLGAHAEQIGVRLAKQVSVVIDDHRVRLDLATYARFFQSLVHLVRNAVDHGLETPDERVRLGKSPRGTLTLRAAIEGEKIRLEISDDGRGVDWDTIGRLASQRGLPFDSEPDRLAALMTDGLTSVQLATDLSGRGVGLGAVKANCDELGIVLSLKSESAIGTQVSFLLERTRRHAYPAQGPLSLRSRSVYPAQGPLSIRRRTLSPPRSQR